MNRLIVTLASVLVTTAAHAGTPTVPEPGTFELLALGGVLAVVFALRRGRRK
jgi:hypothetical protein